MDHASVAQLEVHETLELAANESPLGPSRKVANAVISQLAQANRYPERDCSNTERAIARALSFPAAHVTVGPGSFGMLRLISEAYMSAGSEVVFADPSYPVYRGLAQQAGCIPVAVPLTPDHRHDLPAMAQAITPATRVVFICNPNNPTGRPVSHAELAQFMAQVPAHVLVVIDEAYFEYASGEELPDGTAWVRAGHHVVVLRTFSKAYGLAGMRIGYGVAHEQVAARLRQVRDPFSVNSMAQAAARAALTDEQHLASVRALNDQVRAELCAAVSRMGLRYIPSVTNFVMIQCGGDDLAICEQLAQHGVKVRPGSEYGMRGWLRVSTGTLRQCQRFLLTLQSVLFN
ncbi:MAG TPA: histidinol-phosphate transaminase [Myxococcaceae bacterium]|nr:histidinol-phosphate transaminase [Myxococcaceae bacterium]